ncbi:HIT family protein [Rhizobium johnstonii]|uniref:HIT family protein n=1 Tax=Rhizobium johnstonii TaxID=3019933 RepID=UPI003F95F54F
MAIKKGCAHCEAKGEDRLWQGSEFRVVLVHDTGFDGWCRVIWNKHVSELTDLSEDNRHTILEAVVALEEALRAELAPFKINIASLGTGAPHLHFHVIPRFEDDPTFPDPVWLAPSKASSRPLPEGFHDRMRGRLVDRLGPMATDSSARADEAR